MNRLSSPAWFYQQLFRVSQAVIGELTWRPPAWAGSLKNGVKRRPILCATAPLGLAALLLGGCWLWNWYVHLPKPTVVTWTANLAPIPQPDDNFHPQPLSLTFERSVARLDLIGKEVTRQVTLSAKIKGTWSWTNGSQLVFTPEEVWPAATKIRIKLSRDLFSPHARIETMSKEFSTPPFTAAISDATFYVNPKDPKMKQITATLTFSHPVDRTTLEKNLTLAMENGENVFGHAPTDMGRSTIIFTLTAAKANVTYAPNNTGCCTVTYDKLDRIAYVRSVNVAVPKESAHAILTLPASVATTAGGAGLDKLQTAQVFVPNMASLFSIASAQNTIAINGAGEPVQTIILRTSVGVKPEALASAIHAWILPKPKPHHDPDSDTEIDAWQSAAEIDDSILKAATPLSLILTPSEEEYATLHSFQIKVPEHAWIYLRVDKGLQAMGGFELADAFTSVSQAPPYPREVHIMHDGSILALSGERKLSIESRGVAQLEYRLERVVPSSINHLVSQSEGNFQSPVFNNYNFDETNITEQIIRLKSLADTDPAKNDYSALDFSEFVDGSDANRGKLGLFILRVLAREDGNNGGYYNQDGSILPDPKSHPSERPSVSYRNGEPVDPTDADSILADRRLILVTDLGLIIKDNADSTHDVFVQSIKTGQPVAGAQIDVLGKNGIAVVSVVTDETGHASLPSLDDFTREKRPVAYVARLGDDVSFLPFGREDRELNFSRFDTSGVTGLAPDDLTAFVFTDRGIYRPGDEAHLGLIIKQCDWRGKLDGIPLRLEVVDPRGAVVQSRSLKLNAGGFIETTFPTRETSPTGRYEVNCYLVKSGEDDTLLGSESLRVAEFLPDRMKIKATLSAHSSEGWISATGLTGHVLLQNLYGAPSTGHRITGKLVLNPSQFSFARYPDYTFVDPYLNSTERKSHEEDLPDQTADDSGEATFDLSMANMEPSAYQLSFLAEGFEKEGGRSVTAGAEVLVSPRAWLVGSKPDGDFDYVHLDSKRAVQFLAVDSQLKQISVDHLQLKLIERRYISVLTQKPNGNYAYSSVLKEIPVSEEAVAIPDKGIAWPLNTTQPGDFAARLYDDHGDLVADVRYSVAGTANLTRSLEKNAELTAKLSKPEYQPGEQIEVEITAPYTGSGLLTIERDKVYAHTWFQAKTTASVQKITLPKDFEGNGYLNVTFVRALDSKEIYMSPLSCTVLPFKVNQEARHTGIGINVPQVALPGAPLQMQITASRPTQAVVYVVDEGILQVARYTLPDPLGWFFRKQALEVGTRQTVDLILPEYSIVKELAASGGDADEDALAHHLNPFKRKRDKPVVYWSGIVDIGPDAKTFSYDVPDYFAGTLRVMVVANTADAVGSAEKTLQVRGPFVISPNVPAVVAPGDTFEITAAIANNIEGSGPNASVNLDLQVSDGLEILQKPDSSMTVAEGRDASTRWLLRAKDQLGNADMVITAESAGEKTGIASHVSVRPPVPYLTTLETGYFKENEKRIPLTRKLYPEYREATALVSPLPQGLMRGLGDYLEHYEYGCTEQLVSKAFPTLVSGETMRRGLPRAQVAEKIGQILDVAATRQNDDGAFGLWTARPDLHFDLPSAHIMHFMTEAKEQDYDIPAALMTRGLGHLRKDADGTPGNFREARNQAYEIYLLARNGVVVTNALEHNRDWFEKNAKESWNDDIAAAYEAATYALLKDQDQADALIKGFHLQNPKHRWPVEEIDYDDDLGRAAQYIYLLARHFPDRLKSLDEDDLMTLAYPIINYDFNTVSSAEAILALDSYARAMRQSFLSGAVEIDQLTGNGSKKLDLTPGLYPEAKLDIDADALVFRKSPNTGNAGKLPRGLFYQVTQSGFDHETVTRPVSEGIEVSREYRSGANQPVTTAKLGEELTVVLRVRSTDDQNLENIAIEDLLPGGFEIVEESVHGGPCTCWGGIEYVDVREDRMVAFGSISGTETEITYRIKATNHGVYAIPPPQAEAMYHQKIRARGISGTLTVRD